MGAPGREGAELWSVGHMREAVCTVPAHGVGEGALEEVVILGQQPPHGVAQTCRAAHAQDVWQYTLQWSLTVSLFTGEVREPLDMATWHQKSFKRPQSPGKKGGERVGINTGDEAMEGWVVSPERHHS